MVVDDERDSRDSMGDLLTAEFPGSNVVTMPDAETAASHLIDGGFDLLITDYALPGMNGLELARKLHAYRPSTPCILVTGNVETTPAQKGLAEGVLHGTLHKTMAPSEFLSTV